MPQCVTCGKFTRETRHCSFYNRTIALADIHKQISCQGYPNRVREKWILKVAHRDAVPEEQAKIYYELLPTEAQKL